MNEEYTKKNKKKYDSIQVQSGFCALLMIRLHGDITNSKFVDYGLPIENHTQKKADVIRLRRELNKLRELLEW